MNIAALVSGGVDSSVTVPILKKQGYEPVIFYIKIAMEDVPGFINCPSEEDIEIVTYIAKKFGCQFEVVDLQKEYWEKVIDYTISTVKEGLTPNPDVMCNRLIKFGSFKEKYGNDFDKISTGHYARVIEKDGQHYLATAKDRKKDQTYFLGRITYEQLSRVIFPIWNMEKKKVRQMAEKLKLPSASRPDSQGICFLGKINYNDFIRKYIGEKEGDIIELETGKKLGKHKGYWFHTIGQRKGLKLSQGPWFVVKKDTDNNIIYVSRGYNPASQYEEKVWVKDFRFINNLSGKYFEKTHSIKFKIRHTPEFTSGKIEKINNKYLIHSDERIAGVAPGQFAVVYDNEEKICLGSGIICEKEF